MYSDAFGHVTFRQSGIEPVRQKDVEIPCNLRDPHYTNRLFTRTSSAKTIYLTQGLVATPQYNTDFVEGLYYNYSDRIYSGYDYELIEAGRKRAEEATKGKKSAAYYEVFLRTVYEDESVNLHHILAGVNVSTGYSYHVYGTGDPAPEAREIVTSVVREPAIPRMKAGHKVPKQSWPRHQDNLPPDESS